MIKRILSFLLVVTQSACAQSFLHGYKTEGVGGGDITAPAAVGDLHVDSVQSGKLFLRGTNVGDDINVGTATSFDIRYSERWIGDGEMIANANFTATNVNGWVLLGGGPGTLQYSGAFGHSANGALQLTNTADYCGVNYPIATTARDTVYWSAWVYLAGAGTDTIDFYVLDQNDGILGGSLRVPLTAATWTNVTRKTYLSGTQTSIKPGFNFDPGNASRVIYVDDVSCTIGIDFSVASQAGGEPAPGAAGTQFQYTLQGLTDGILYHVRMKVADEVPNWGGLSVQTSGTPNGPSIPSGGGGITDVSTGYHVDPARPNDTGDGKSWAAAFKTIGKLTSVLGSEALYDTGLVKQGDYNERIVSAFSGTPSQRLVIMRNGADSVRLLGSGTNLNTVTITHNNYQLDHLIIGNQYYQTITGNNTYRIELNGDNLKLLGCRTYTTGDPWTNMFIANRTGRGIAVTGQNVLIDSCYIHGFMYNCVVAGGSPRYFTMMHSRSDSSGSANVTIVSTDDNSTNVQGNYIFDNDLFWSYTEDNIQWEQNYSDGMNTAYNNGHIIKGNRMGPAAENVTDGKGARYIFIENNVIFGSMGDDEGLLDGGSTGNSGPAIERGGEWNTTPGLATKTDWQTVRYNQIYDNSGGYVMAEGDVCYNNNFLNNRRSYLGPNQASGFNFTGYTMERRPNRPRFFKNNILVQHNLAALVWDNMDYTGGDPQFFTDYNVWYDSAGTVAFANAPTGQGQSVYTSLATWKSFLNSTTGYTTIGGKEAHSIEGNPGFNNAPLRPYNFSTAWDYTLKQTSVAVNAGTSLSVATNTAASPSTNLTVDNAQPFRTNFGNPYAQNDSIKIGSAAPVGITAINYGSNTITLNAPRTWSSGAAVYLWPFNGSAPDIGAKESVY